MIPKAEFKVSYFFRRALEGDHGLVYIKSKQNSDRQTVYNTGIKMTRRQFDDIGDCIKPKPERFLELESRIKSIYKSMLRDGKTPDLSMIIMRMLGQKELTRALEFNWTMTDDRASIPSNLKGVYRLTVDNEVIYVGMSNTCIKSRLKCHKHLLLLKRQGCRVIIHYAEVSNILESESYLISLYKPSLNIQGKGDLQRAA